MSTTEEQFREKLRQARIMLYRTVALTDDELATIEAHQPGAPSEDVTTAQLTAIPFPSCGCAPCSPPEPACLASEGERTRSGNRDAT